MAKKQNLWEGFKNEKLRVIVSYSPDYDEFENENLIEQRLIHAAKSRVASILISHVRVNYSDLVKNENANQIVQKIEAAIDSIKLILKFGDLYTFSGIYEADVNVLINYLTSISNNDAE